MDTLEAKIRELCPNLPENIRGFRAPKKKDKPAQPEIKVVVNNEGAPKPVSNCEENKNI